MSLSLLLKDLFEHLLELAMRPTLLVFSILVIYHLYHSFVFVMAIIHQPHLSLKVCFDFLSPLFIHYHFLYDQHVYHNVRRTKAYEVGVYTELYYRKHICIQPLSYFFPSHIHRKI